jgi:pyridoxamine 5'-phosphate oxidase
MKIAELRREYRLQALAEEQAFADPLHQFEQWFHEARAAKVPEPNAMTLATTARSGRPMARIVLLKSFDTSGFTFFTNYASNKGEELQHNPWASLVFFWVELERQVRIEGKVERIPAAESDAYFKTRPLLSRVSAWASPQSKVIESRHWLEQAFAAAQQRFGEAVPRPEYWGGYRLLPDTLEFWQGRENRLHDRLCYRKADQQAWRIERLAP